MTEGTPTWQDLVGGPANAAPTPPGAVDGIAGEILNASGLPTAVQPPAAPPAPPPPAGDTKPPAGNNGGGSGTGSGGGKGGAGTAAQTDQNAGAAVDASAANSQTGFANSQANLDQLRAEIERLGPILDTPEGQQQLMDALQRYLSAGGGQLQSTDGAAQQQAGDLQGLLDQLSTDKKKPSSKDDRDSKDDDEDSGSSKKDDSGASDIKDLLSSLGPALQSLNPFGQQGGLGGQQSPFGSPMGQQNPFGQQQSPFGPNSTGSTPGVTPAANPFGSVPGASPAGMGSAAGGGSTPGGTPGSPFDALKTEAEKQAEGGGGDGQGGEHKDDPNSKTVTWPDGTTTEAPTVEAAQALRASMTNDNATAAYEQAGIDVNNATLVDPNDVQAGDYAKWEDGRISPAYGPGRVLSNGQVVDVNTVTGEGDGFEGWYHPEDGGNGAAPQPETTVTASQTPKP